jgi:hypothetical protein
MSPYAHTKVFTTGQISKICQVAPRTVSKWFDTGRLSGYRIPGSNDRRVPRENLIAFMKEHGIPLGPLAIPESLKILLVGLSESLQHQLRRELPADRYEFSTAATAFDAGVQAALSSPHCIVLDTGIGKDEAEGMARNLKHRHGAKAPLLVALLPASDADETMDLTLFDDRFRPPFDVALLAGRIRQLGDRTLVTA